MDGNVLSGLLSVIGMLVTGWFGYITAKHKNKKEFTVSDRQLLSEDERQFRKELRDELERNRQEIKVLREEVESLRKQNLSLEMENKQLQIKIDQLRAELKGRWNKYDQKKKQTD